MLPFLPRESRLHCRHAMSMLNEAAVLSRVNQLAEQAVAVLFGKETGRQPGCGEEFRVGREAGQAQSVR
jgi:hypothetical protein